MQYRIFNKRRNAYLDKNLYLSLLTFLMLSLLFHNYQEGKFNGDLNNFWLLY